MGLQHGTPIDTRVSPDGDKGDKVNPSQAAQKPLALVIIKGFERQRDGDSDSIRRHIFHSSGANQSHIVALFSIGSQSRQLYTVGI